MRHRGFFDARYLLLPAEHWANAGPVTEALGRAGWPFGPLRASPAFGVDTLPPPAGWLPSASEWARVQSHARVLEEALQVHAQRVLVLEHGVAFGPGLAERWSTVVDEAGDRWTGMRLYGGRPELPVAYALQGRGVARLYRALRAPNLHEDFAARFAELRRGGVRTSTHQLAAAPPPRPLSAVSLVGAPRAVAAWTAALQAMGVGWEEGDRALHQLIEEATPPDGPRMPGPEFRARLELLRAEVGPGASSAGRDVLANHPRLSDVGELLSDVLGPHLLVLGIGEDPWPHTRRMALPAAADPEASLRRVAEALVPPRLHRLQHGLRALREAASAW